MEKENPGYDWNNQEVYNPLNKSEIKRKVGLALPVYVEGLIEEQQ
jgi:hypothetical protein